MPKRLLILLTSLCLFPCALSAAPIEATLELPPSENNPRNSEGDFIQLQDGRILFVYTHFKDGAGDHDEAILAGRYSSDGGRSWTEEDTVILENEGDFNVMSVSLLRLQSGRIALFYIRKNSTHDCTPYVRYSDDEAKTWSEPIHCLAAEEGYYVLNNDRVVQLRSGRILLPVARHALKAGGDWTGHGTIMVFYSDDEGKTWACSKSQLREPEGTKHVLQEPGVVELNDGSIFMFIRSSSGYQYASYSKDQGETWTEVTLTDLHSPVSPATIERVPGTDRLLCVWNDHREIPKKLKGKRTPLTLAASDDEGKTWTVLETLEDHPDGWFCYTAMDFLDDALLLGYCAGDRRHNNGLAHTRITRIEQAVYSPR